MVIIGLGRNPNPSFAVIAILTIVTILIILRREAVERYTTVTGSSINNQHESTPDDRPSPTKLAHGGAETTSTSENPVYQSPEVPSIPIDIINPAQPTSKTTTLITGHTKDEDVGWLRESFRAPEYRLKIYSVDDPNSKTDLHTPINKGRETMPILTYIIDSYDDLSDVNIFIHPHQYAWHTTDTPIPDTVELIHRLNLARVERLGYVNLRCRWNPGCPVHMDTGSLEAGNDMPEQTIFGPSFREIFGADAEMPPLIGGACCSQFAATRTQIRSVPLARWRAMRDWIRATNLDDGMSGRVFESLWQYVFLGEAVSCPREHLCYCDAYGLCFGGADAWEQNEWLHGRRGEIDGRVRRLDEAIKELEEKNDKVRKPGEEPETDGDKAERKDRITMLQDERKRVATEVERLSAVIEANTQKAFENGNDPVKRAKELAGE